jgi:hypothetical protein
MFQKARIKLTAWYLLIIMTVSISFSLVIYQALKNELDRFERASRFRFERRIDPEIIEESRHRLGIILITINGIIFLFLLFQVPSAICSRDARSSQSPTW